jgi:Pentapeptide repeats (8 copies)/Protein of unknown function (DUF2510)
MCPRDVPGLDEDRTKILENARKRVREVETQESVRTAGWYPDPAGRHQTRYWDGGNWSQFVTDQGRQSTDPLNGAKPETVSPSPTPWVPRTVSRPKKETHWGRWASLIVIIIVILGVGMAMMLNGTDVLGGRCGQIEAGADLKDCDLKSENLKQEDLSNANLAGADLQKANLTESNLAGADLSGANITGAKFRGADLTGVTLDGAQGIEKANLLGVKGLTDGTLAAGLGVSQGNLPSYLAEHGIQLDPPGLIKSSLAKVCDGGKLPQGAARPNGTLAVQGRRTWGFATHHVPKSWGPVAQHHAARVACFRIEPIVVETCSYTLHPVTREQEELFIDVRDVRSGKEVASTSFTGGSPRTCPFSLSESTYSLQGKRVSDKVINAWLKPYLGG